MELIKTNIDGVTLLRPKVFGDHRGYFFESYNLKKFETVIGRNLQFVQDNQSMSGVGVLRGLHFQKPPFDQGKLVRVVHGSVLDVVVDIRSNSETYGQSVCVKLDSDKKEMLWIPPGMAHGFVSLEENTIFFYKCTNFYFPSSEGCILWNDPTLNIDWGVKDPIISAKDMNGELFENFESPFKY